MVMYMTIFALAAYNIIYSTTHSASLALPTLFQFGCRSLVPKNEGGCVLIRTSCLGEDSWSVEDELCQKQGEHQVQPIETKGDVQPINPKGQ